MFPDLAVSLKLVFGLLTAFAGGSTLNAIINNRAKKHVTAAEANKIESDSIAKLLSGPVDTLFENMQKEIKRQANAIKILEDKIKSRDEEIDKLEEKNRRIYQENLRLRVEVEKLGDRVGILESSSS